MRLHGTLARVCAAATLLAAVQVHAQSVSLVDEGEGAGTLERHPRGVYTGVKPGSDEAPAIPGAKPGMTPPAITWPGFQMRPDGSSRVFVQTTSPVDVTSAIAGDKFIVDFGDAKIVGQTNRLPLYTKFFNTPVTQVELTRENKRTRMVLTLRAAVQPRVSSEQAKSGYHFVYVDFPAGNYLESEAPPAPPSPEAAPSAAAPPAPNGAVQQAPSHLDGDVTATGRVRASASADAELPPGMGKVKAGGKAKTSGKVKVGF